jgi:hypothetical protein
MADGKENCDTCGPGDLKVERVNGRNRVMVPDNFMADKLGSPEQQVAEAMQAARMLESQGIRIGEGSDLNRIQPRPTDDQPNIRLPQPEAPEIPRDFETPGYLDEPPIAIPRPPRHEAPPIETPVYDLTPSPIITPEPKLPARTRNFTIAETDAAPLVPVQFQQKPDPEQPAENGDDDPEDLDVALCKLPDLPYRWPGTTRRGHALVPHLWDIAAMREEVERHGIEVIRLSLTVYRCNDADPATALQGAAALLMQAGIELDYSIEDCPEDADPAKPYYGLSAPEGGLVLVIGSADSASADAARQEGEAANGYGEQGQDDEPGRRSVVWGTGVNARVIAHEIGHNAGLDHDGHARERDIMGNEYERDELEDDKRRGERRQHVDGLRFTKENRRALRRMARTLAEERRQAEEERRQADKAEDE